MASLSSRVAPHSTVRAKRRMDDVCVRLQRRARTRPAAHRADSAAPPLDASRLFRAKHPSQRARSTGRIGARANSDAARTAKHASGCAWKRAVERLVILALAPRAHREFLHRRVLAIVGELLDDRKPRPAVRAVDKRVAVSPIVGVHKLAGAILARCQIGRNERGLLHGAGVRKADLERRRSPRAAPPRASSSSTCAAAGRVLRTAR